VKPSAFARALGASMAFDIGADEQARRITLEQATEEAIRLATVLRCPAWVYRIDGRLTASTNEPELMPGAEVIQRIE
jgi:hypothetical protein